MMPNNGPVCLGTSPNHQTPQQQSQGGLQQASQGQGGPNGGPRNNGPDGGLLMTANGPPPNGSSGYYGMDVPQQQQPLNVQAGGGSGVGPVSTTSPTGGVDVPNPNGNTPGGGLLTTAQGTPQNGYMPQPQPNNAAAVQNNYSTTGQGTWTGSNTLTYTQAMQPDLQRQQGNYCE